ncbi:MAG: ferredoxin family protein [Candidatus Adiutrix sp.]|jgi:2-oxoglutarate ferredoxin oxidoreductase subunit delta|nr:ferredoxin family protein [Candidatus Adiutrix sp.]
MARTVFNEDRCKGCGLCIEACPKKILAFAEHRLNHNGYQPVASLRPGECTGCAICARTCPDVVISVYREARSAAEATVQGADL